MLHFEVLYKVYIGEKQTLHNIKSILLSVTFKNKSTEIRSFVKPTL